MSSQESQAAASACTISARQSMLYAKDLARLYKLEKERDEDLRAGARVQHRFLTPAGETERMLEAAGYGVAILNTAPASISGDFYFPRSLGGEAVGFLLADTCGHGLPAALLSMRIASFIQGAAGQAATPAAFLCRVNSDIHGLDLQGAFVAGIYVSLHASGCSIANAGQPYPYLLRQGQVEELALPGPPLGLSSECACRQHALQLAEGDRLVLHTDGIVEAARPDGECFGAARLTLALEKHAQAPLQVLVDGVMEELEAFLQGAPQEDDYTLVVVEKRRPPEDKAVRGCWTGKACLGPAESERDALYEQFLQDAAGAWKDDTAADLLLLSLVEAVNNAVEHGNRMAPGLKVAVRYLMAPNLCLAMVRDEGQGFTPSSDELRDITGSRGRGLAIIRENTDVFFFNRQGNTCVLCKGANTVKMDSSSVRANIAPVHGGCVLITDMDFGMQKVNIANGLSEIFESLGGLEKRCLFVDVGKVRLISSMGWGTIFAQAEMPLVKRIVLFNASEAVMRSAEQMGLPRNEGPYAKITITRGCTQAMELLAVELCESLGQAGSERVAESLGAGA